jgi:hypothetical protein
MAGGWYAQPNDAWLETVALLEAGGGPWSEAFQISDLRWWAGQVRIKAEKRIPGHKTLSKRWDSADYARHRTVGSLENRNQPSAYR